MSKPETEFVIYMIHEVANRNNLYPSQVYKAMVKSGCIKNYLVPYYDVLHTMSSESVADDVLEYVNSRGVAL